MGLMASSILRLLPAGLVTEVQVVPPSRVFQSVPLLQRALLPWIVITQTIPFVATAPMIVIWGGRNGWEPWIPVAMLSAYLAFFPVTINVLRGLNAPSEEHLELMRSVAANRREVLVRLRFPAALPYLFSGLRLAAAAAEDHWGDRVSFVPLSHNGGFAAGNNAALRPAFVIGPW